MFKRYLYAQDIIDELLSYDSQLKLAYEAVQLLHYYRKKKDIDGFFSTIQTLDKALPKWFRKKYKQGIQNAFELRYSNGVTEGLNNKIKLIKRVSYGYRNFYHLRDRIYIIQGLIFAPRWSLICIINKSFEDRTSDSKKNTLCPLRQKTKCELLWFSALALN